MPNTRWFLSAASFSPDTTEDTAPSQCELSAGQHQTGLVCPPLGKKCRHSAKKVFNFDHEIGLICSNLIEKSHPFGNPGQKPGYESFIPLRMKVYFCHQNQNAKNIGNFTTLIETP
jgi:hypothetical protein